MRGRFYIDGRDALAEYGVLVERYGYKGLIQYPAFKKLTATSWPGEDGDEVDLSDVRLDTRSFQMQFIIKNVRYAEDFFDDLSTGAYHEFEFPELGKTYKLRMSQNGTFSQHIKLGKLVVTFHDDFPKVPDGEPYRRGRSEIRQVGYELDGVDMSQFGAWVLQGSDESIRKAANTKDNLKIDNKTLSGIIYDGDYVNFKTKDVTLKLLIDCDGIVEFWKRYDSLYTILLKSDKRIFYYTALNAEYDCYYKSCNVQKFDILRNGKVWCEFNLVLTFTNYRPVGQYMLLAHEDFALVEVLVNNEPTLIRIRPKRGISLLVHQSGEYVIVNTGNDQSQIYLND